MSRRSDRLLALSTVVALTLGACGGGTATAVIETVDAAAAAALVANPRIVILDIRTPEEYATGHLKGALNIDFYAPDFAAQIGALDRDTEYLVYCHSGNRSGQAMDLFRDLDFTAVHELGGGILSWSAAGLPITTG